VGPRLSGWSFKLDGLSRSGSAQFKFVELSRIDLEVRDQGFFHDR
jgi:hypothetical protein